MENSLCENATKRLINLQYLNQASLTNFLKTAILLKWFSLLAFTIMQQMRKLVAQWNFSIADMLYSEHLSIADNILENQFFYWNLPLYSGHLLIANIFFENKWCPLWRGSTVAVLEKSLKKQYFLHLIPYNSRLP